MAYVGHGTWFVNQVCVLRLKLPASLLMPGILAAEVTQPTESASAPCSRLQPLFQAQKELNMCIEHLLFHLLKRRHLRFLSLWDLTYRVRLGFHVLSETAPSHVWVWGFICERASERASQGPTAWLNRRVRVPLKAAAERQGETASLCPNRGRGGESAGSAVLSSPASHPDPGEVPPGPGSSSGWRQKTLSPKTQAV